MLLFLLVHLLATCQLNPRKCELFWATKSTVERGWVVGNIYWVFRMEASSQNCSQRVSSLRIILCDQCRWLWRFGCRIIMNQSTSFIQFSNGYKQVRYIPTPVVMISARIFFFWSDCTEHPEDITVSYLRSRGPWLSVDGTATCLTLISFDVSRKWEHEPRTSRINKKNKHIYSHLAPGVHFFLCYQLSLALTCVFGICNDT